MNIKFDTIKALYRKILIISMCFVMVVGTISASAASKKTVGTQKKLVSEMNKAKAKTIVLKTDKTLKISIPQKSKSKNKVLLIDAPNATVVNKSCFKSITIKSVKTYTEKVSGNTIVLEDDAVPVIIYKGITVKKLTAPSKNANIKLNKKAAIESLEYKVTDQLISFPIAIDSKSFPDDNFRTYILDSFDQDKDGMLSESEADAVNEIIVWECSIKSLDGIQFFQNLVTLDCFANFITELDISNNPLLENLNCADNMLTELDISRNTKLKTLYCGYNRLKSLNIKNHVNLEELICNENNLTNLDVSNNIKLVKIDCDDNALTSLDISKNTELKELNCQLNNLTTLDTTNNTKLEKVFYDESVILLGKIGITESLFPDSVFRDYVKKFDIDGDGYLSDNEIKAVDTIDVSGMNITSLEGISVFRTLKKLNCSETSIINLNLSNIKVDELIAKDNNVLESVSCDNIGLKSIDVSNCPIWSLHIGWNDLKEINLSKLNVLRVFSCQYNSISKLDLSNCLLLTQLICFGNQIKTLDLSNNTSIYGKNYIQTDPEVTIIWPDIELNE